MKHLLLSKNLTEQIEALLTPFFTEMGFAKQDIYNYYRYHKPFIHCVNLQKRSDRKAICVNLGVHLDFLPVPARLEIPPVSDIVQMDCAIRDRLKPEGMSDYWWPVKPAKKQVKSIKELFQKEGTTFFEKYTSFPHVFESITIENIKSNDAFKILPGLKRRSMALFLSQVYEYIGQKEKAIRFSEYGLEIIKDANPIHIRSIKKAFQDIIQRSKKT